jgi:spore coat protein U-like protein
VVSRFVSDRVMFMAFGTGKEDDPGGWQQQPPKLTDSVEDEPAQQPPTPPAQSAPPALPTKDEVTPETIRLLALDVLPTNKDAVGFASWRNEVLLELADQALELSEIDLAALVPQLREVFAKLQDATIDLNNKKVSEPKDTPCEPIPQACQDATCRSLFDVNELAIRGRKAVTTKRFYIPMIFPEVLLRPDQKWGFGQKVEYDQEWRHEGFTLGSLVSSFSLLPNEDVTIEVSSWQKSKSEVQQETDQTTRQSLEQELKRTDEQTISNEAANQSGWSISATAAVSYGPVSASASASANGSSSERAQDARKTVQETTQKATSEVSSRRAVKLAFTSEAGSESKSMRRMRNPNECHTVTYNFFQVIKLIDLQMRFINDAPVIYFPGLFPARYSNGQIVRIPYETIESFTSPSLFLTQFFDVDRDLSQEIHGIAFRVRMDAGRSPREALNALAEAMFVAIKYLLQLDPAQHVAAVGRFLASYAESALKLRRNSLENYGTGKGESLQLNTPGMYVDSLLGRCSACEDSIILKKVADLNAAAADRRAVDADAALVELEHQRRTDWLKRSEVDPFEPAPIATV